MAVTNVMEAMNLQGASYKVVVHSHGIADELPATGEALADAAAAPADDAAPEEPLDPVKEAEKEVHRAFMNEALDMARFALRHNETPVGCVLVYRGRIIAKGMNATNVTRNGTRHAELMALNALLSRTPKSDIEEDEPVEAKEQPREGGGSAGTHNKKRKGKKGKNVVANAEVPGSDAPAASGTAQKVDEPVWGDVDPSDGHIYPYGQKLHPSPRVDEKVLHECILYVTVEPCVMCASLLRQYGIKKVYFGAVNDKFGGTGGVFRVHRNSRPVSELGPIEVRPAEVKTGKEFQDGSHKLKKQLQKEADEGSDSGASSGGKNNESKGAGEYKPTTIAIAEGTVPSAGEGDGGNVEPGFDVEGGWGRDEAVSLLRQFYVQENGRAPVPRKKEGRAARLVAMMEREGKSAADILIPIPPVNGDGSSSSSPMPASPIPGGAAALGEDVLGVEMIGTPLADATNGAFQAVDESGNTAARAALNADPLAVSTDKLAAALRSATLEDSHRVGDAENGEHDEDSWQTVPAKRTKDATRSNTTRGGGNNRGGRRGGDRGGRGGRGRGGYGNNSRPSSAGGANGSGADD